MAHPVFVVAPYADRFRDLGLEVYPDLIPDIGAIGGLYTALERSPEESVIVVACDQPFLEEDVLRRLVELAADADGAWLRTPKGVEPLIACYRRQSLAAIRGEIDAGRLKLADLEQVLDMRGLDAREVMTDRAIERLVANINTPDDYARIE